MSQETIVKNLKDIVSEYVEINGEFNPAMSLQGDIGLDSFSMISMVCQIENKFDIRIPDSELMHFLTLTDLVDYIYKAKAA